MIEARPLRKEDVVQFKCHPDFIEKGDVLRMIEWLKEHFQGELSTYNAGFIREILDKAVREIKNEM